MKRIKKRNRKKSYFTYLLASIVIFLIAILAILLINIDQFRSNTDSKSVDKENITQKAKDHDKKMEDKEPSDSVEPTIIDTGTLNDVIENAQSIDRNYYTDESLSKLDQALANAHSAIQNNGNQQEINDATIDLVNAIITLENK